MFCAKVRRLKRYRIMIRSLVFIVLKQFYAIFIVKLQQILVMAVYCSKVTAKMQCFSVSNCSKLNYTFLTLDLLTMTIDNDYDRFHGDAVVSAFG